MSVAFVSRLRAGRPPIELVPAGPDTITFRVQIAEQWDSVRVVARADDTVREVKERVMQAFYPEYEYSDELVLKLRGWEILDESARIGESGIVDGSIVLLGDRRRRPVR